MAAGEPIGFRSFRLAVPHSLGHIRFPASPRRTVREVFPHTAHRPGSHGAFKGPAERCHGAVHIEVEYPLPAVNSPASPMMWCASAIPESQQLARIVLDVLERSPGFSMPEVRRPASEHLMDLRDGFPRRWFSRCASRRRSRTVWRIRFIALAPGQRAGRRLCRSPCPRLVSRWWNPRKSNPSSCRRSASVSSPR